MTVKKSICHAAFFLLALVTLVPVASAQKYPEKNIRLVVAFPTGAAYVLALMVADRLREPLGQSIVPDFKSGAGGNVAAEIVAKTPPDGYTLLLTSPSIAISPSLYSKLGYDTFRDFVPITLLATVPNVMVVHPSVPAKSLTELIKLAKAKPGTLNFGSGGLGSGSQLGSELFKTQSKINILHVPYKGAAIAMNAMLSGEVDMVTSTVPATIPLVNAGRIRALAVMANERVAMLPKVPTAAEAGMPELVVITWYGLFAPTGTKPEIITRLHEEFVKMMRLPEVKAKLVNVELDANTSASPAEFAKFVRAEHDKWARVIKEAGIPVQQQ
jgi:tripartite-type tricarboxylate transporter receptor subunit TctC